ncbi:MAG: alpha/beta hydrolase-fold protein [Candidatus Aminicenantes bacterium]|nr:alpha/beta hydrolase-fold protein [Candidatus Aminicenantes bacterium]
MSNILSRLRSQFARITGLAVLLLAAFSCQPAANGKASVLLKFAVSFPAERSAAPLDGRILLLISNDGSAEPRFQVSDGAATQIVFGIDVDGLAPGTEAVIDASVFGYPLPSLADLPAGEYYVQALFNRYETYTRSDGHTVKLPPDKGEGQRWNAKPGNLYSAPEKITIDPMASRTISLSLNKEIPPIAPPRDTKHVKHIKIRSEKLSAFWGRPVELGACLLLPEGFNEHPNARYPLIVYHGHFPYTVDGFREEPPDPNLKPDYSDRFHLPGYNRIQEEYAYQFYKDWTGKDFPRAILMEIQHANPYYDDSYAVNSANLGPYGDAIVYELIPYIEKTFRGLGAGWARYLYGGSTGGWEALASQVFYPDEFNGCVAACPDPIDFRAYTVVDIYSQKNAYYPDGPWKKTPRPGLRNYLGEVATTLEQANHRELAIASKGRSGDQWDIWQAVFSPVGADGYPKPIWDKRTGVIDPQVAAYWKEHYDLGAILQRDWKTLGPKLQGKIRIYVGDMDNYYLNNAVYLVESFLKSTKDPYYAGDVAYGDRAEHCWNGDPTRPNALSRLRYHQMYIPQAVERMRKTAPLGADLTSWKY